MVYSPASHHAEGASIPANPVLDLYSSRQLSTSLLDYWRDLAVHNERMIRGLGPSMDHRRSISSVEYWKIEAECLNQRYWDLVQQKQTQPQSQPLKKRKTCQNGPTFKVTKQTVAQDGPIHQDYAVVAFVSVPHEIPPSNGRQGTLGRP